MPSPSPPSRWCVRGRTDSDGLLEAPDRSLAETIPALERTVASHLPAAGCAALCDAVLAARPDKTQRDDIALLALRLDSLPAPFTIEAPAVPFLKYIGL
jgi:hypothetical protein